MILVSSSRTRSHFLRRFSSAELLITSIYRHVVFASGIVFIFALCLVSRVNLRTLARPTLMVKCSRLLCSTLPDARDQPITPRTANGLNPAHPSIDLFILDGDLEFPPPSPSVNELVIGIIALKRRISTYDQTNTMAGTRANL